MNSIWYYLTSEDMKTWAKNITDKKLFYQLQNQCLKRIPMLKQSYERIKKQYQ
jgi:hypothetical protein